ncbi:MAG: hypothetical protein MUE49_12135, partial [Rhodospirillales bacterium]|nr:hypothetical protein [Rhodospirillales bacterium]
DPTLDSQIKNQFQIYLSDKRVEYSEQLTRNGNRNRAIRELLLSAKQGAGIKAWLKIIPPLLLSRGGFRALRLMSGRAFSRQG